MEDCMMDCVEATEGTLDAAKCTEGTSDAAKSTESIMDNAKGTEGTLNAAKCTESTLDTAEGKEGTSDAAKNMEGTLDAAEGKEGTLDGVESTVATKVRRKIMDTDPFFGPGTIESDDEVDRLSNSDSDDDTHEIRYRRRDEDTSDVVFYQDFNFNESVMSYQKDTWDDVLKYLGKATPSVAKKTIEAISRVREAEEKIKERRNARLGIREPSLLELGGKDDGSEELVLEPTKDTLKVNEAEARRKERKLYQPEKQKTKAELEFEEEVNKCFEDVEPSQPDITFLEMNFSRPLIKAIHHVGYTNPTPIQAATIPLALLGRDICACAATGTGKTAAYMLPILDRLTFKPKHDLVTRVLVLVPTRELGIQVFQVSKGLAKYTNTSITLSVGGLDLKIQESELSKSPDVVIATPGRLIDHVLNCPGFDLANIEILVVDEADRMVQKSFVDQIKEIIEQCSPNRQVLLFSATMTTDIKEMAMISLKNPVKVFVNENTDVARNLRQEFVQLRKEADRDGTLAYLVLRSFVKRCLVFTDSKTEVHRLFVLLGLLGVNTGEIHGDLMQADRLMYLKKFRDGDIDVLVSTDVSARGLDIGGIKTIINHKVPYDYTSYVHRVGRTARAGRSGRAVTLVLKDQFLKLREIKKKSKSAVYQRILDKGVLAKYVEKVDQLGSATQMVMMEEKTKQELDETEKSIERAEKLVRGPVSKKKEGGGVKPPERSWFVTDKDLIIEKTRKLAKRARMNKNKKNSDGKKQKQKQKQSVENGGVTPEEQLVRKAVRTDQRKAKKTQKMKSLTRKNECKFIDNTPQPSAVNKKKKRRSTSSSFAEELVDVRRKSVKKFRAGSSFSKRKEAFQAKNPGRKFDIRKRNANYGRADRACTAKVRIASETPY